MKVGGIAIAVVLVATLAACGGEPSAAGSRATDTGLTAPIATAPSQTSVPFTESWRSVAQFDKDAFVDHILGPAWRPSFSRLEPEFIVEIARTTCEGLDARELSTTIIDTRIAKYADGDRVVLDGLVVIAGAGVEWFCPNYVNRFPRPDPSVPLIVSEPSASTAPTEDELLLDYVRDELPGAYGRLGEARVLRVAHGVCDYLSSGGSVGDVAVVISDEYADDPDANHDISQVAGAAIGTLCPEFG